MVKFYNADRGFGFIMADDGMRTYLSTSVGSRTALRCLLKVCVTFEVGLDRKTLKTKAANVGLAGNDSR